MRSLWKMIFPERGQTQNVTAPQETFRPEDLQPREAYRRNYWRYNTEAVPRPSEAQNISKHPVIHILLRMDEIRREDDVGHRIDQQAARRRAELEACLAALHKGATKLT